MQSLFAKGNPTEVYHWFASGSLLLDWSRIVCYVKSGGVPYLVGDRLIVH